jgi:prophage regulatory protein
MANTTPTLWRTARVLDERGVRKTQHYEDIKNGLFTRPVKIGKRASAWPQHETAALNAARIAGKSDDEIRQLVAELEAARTFGADSDTQ